MFYVIQYCPWEIGGMWYLIHNINLIIYHFKKTLSNLFLFFANTYLFSLV